MQPQRLMDALTAGQKLLQEKGIEAARLEAEIMMSHILGCERHRLYIMGNEPLEDHVRHDFETMLQRRLRGEPIQYITGRREFMGLVFEVDSRVLIPRNDTEVLVEHVIDRLSRKSGLVRILDIGTGSGAIAISLAAFLPGSLVTALDISRDSLDLARHNAQLNNVSDRVEFVCADLFPDSDDGQYEGFFDAIVSNPPYIPAGEIEGLMTEVRDFEPRRALDGGSDGLDFYRRIAAGAHYYLKPRGFIAVEMGIGQSEAVKDIFSNTGRYENAVILKDLAGIERVAVFKLN